MQICLCRILSDVRIFVEEYIILSIGIFLALLSIILVKLGLVETVIVKNKQVFYIGMAIMLVGMVITILNYWKM